ncbi:unnamed protein product [Moneuplotes crassus]|uniref:Uncharacterized protein n=1 Tax=Euplotes crassus TaxID=5936 RepID=A0AAD1XVR0_EUPCR|nr:unnamed protein product [Moneuplotes crassus]
MGKTYSTLKWKFKGRKAYSEYAIQHEIERYDFGTLDKVCRQYYNADFGTKQSDRISMDLEDYEDKQALSKIAELALKVEKLQYIEFSSIQKNEKKLNKLLNDLRVKNLKRLYFDAHYSGSVLFSFYSRNIARFLPLATELVQINNFRVSHKDFGRVLVACQYSSKIVFQKCRIIINGFDYLDNAQPSIGDIHLHYNTIIQPEEDNEFLDGLIQKMADSSLNDSLKHVLVKSQDSIRRGKKILPKNKYTIGNFDVKIY